MQNIFAKYGTFSSKTSLQKLKSTSKNRRKALCFADFPQFFCTTRHRGAFSPTTISVNTEEFCKISQKFKLFARFLQGFWKVFQGGSAAKHTHFRTFLHVSQFLQPNNSMCCPGPTFSAATKVFHFSVKHLGHHSIYRKFMWEPSVYIILHVWLLQICNDCKNVELLWTWGVLMQNLLNFTYCNVICKSEVCQQNQWEIAK